MFTELCISNAMVTYFSYVKRIDENDCFWTPFELSIFLNNVEFLLSLLKIVRLKKSKYMEIWKLNNFEIRIIEKLDELRTNI